MVILPPWALRPLRVLLVGLLAWLLLEFLRSAWRSRASAFAPARAVAPLLMMSLAVGAMGHAPAARAQAFPDQALLDQLRQRLLEAPACAPQCASIAEVAVEANGDAVKLVLEAHAEQRVAIPLPTDERGWALRSVSVNGAAAEGLQRRNGTLWIALPRGVHRVEMSGIAIGDSMALPFELTPHRASFKGEGWQVNGIAEERLVTNAINLARLRSEGDRLPSSGEQRFAPYVRVIRTLTFDLDWSVQTSVQRLSPRQGGFTVDVPLLTGEHVTTPGVEVSGGKATVGVADGSDAGTWSSTLDKTTTLTLTAPPMAERVEVWQVVTSPTWHVEASGVPMLALQAGADQNDYRVFEFYPLPGETLSLAITRPQAVKGETKAIDRVSLDHQVGQRSSQTELGFTLRATQGGEHAIVLPEGAEIVSVQRDSEALNTRPIDRRLTLPVKPGSQRFSIVFRQNQELGFASATPPLELGLPIANIDTTLRLPDDRWLLATRGPHVGPAVLYWGQLIVLLALAYGLSRTRRTPLRLWQWLLLGLGFSAFSWPAWLIVVAWLFAFDARARHVPASRWTFNLVQVGLVVITVLTVLVLFGAVRNGLLGAPDMAVTGNGSYAHFLRWFLDRTSGALPIAHAYTLPVWIYRIAMLAWALWMANALIGWMRHAFSAWTAGGYWRRRPPKPHPDAPVVPEASVVSPESA